MWEIHLISRRIYSLTFSSAPPLIKLKMHT